MTDTKNSNLCEISMILISLPLSFSCGYQFVMFNPLSPILQNIFNNTYQNRYNELMPDSTWISLLSITLSAMMLGGFVESLCVKSLLRHMSRKRLMQTFHVINLVAIMLVALAGRLSGSYEVFIIGRILAGFPLGAVYNLIPIMIAEMSTKKKQEMRQGIMGIGASFGFLFGSILAHPKVLGSSGLWPVAVAFPGIPTILHLVASLWIPNTLFYVMRQGDKDKTMQLLRQMREGDEDSLEKEYEAIQREIKGYDVVDICEVIKTKQYRLQLVAAICLVSNLMLCGANNFSLYSDRIFIGVGIAEENATYGTIGMFALQFIMSIVGTRLIDCYGGRKVILFASSGQMTALILFSISQAFLHSAPSVMPYLTIAAAIMFFACWSGGTNLATMALLGAVTIEPTRETILGFACIPLWISAWFVGYIPPYLKVGLGAYSMALWLICSIVFLIYFVFFLPETKGKTVDQIQAKFLPKQFHSHTSNSGEHKV